ncbi:lycopene cyclase domain-containing protein [Nocardioides pantholopis]|uniref:lycopene cyclase domain-containing protein n=1 Tax=Nocardioides pantholopis TaxID=2483798 RepID=UPI000F076E2D|nr:lycopene cyclase domain-containing protein [Nocardioides pantholopis]
MTYLALSGLFLGVAVLALALAAVVRRPPAAWWAATGLTAVALLVLTAVFDNLMIAVDLFRYEGDQISGVLVGRAPIEDFAWPLAAVAGLPALWLLLGRSR